MTEHQIPAASLDDGFIRLLIEELSESNLSSADTKEPVENAGAGTLAGTHVPDPPPIPLDGGEPPARTDVAEQEARPEPSKGKGAEVPATSSAPETVRWQLRLRQPGEAECVLPLEKDPITVGRGSKNLVVPKCERVSRNHARIWIDRTGPRVDDLGSRNGTLVNGMKVPAAYLKADDIILIGTLEIRVEAVRGDEGATG